MSRRPVSWTRTPSEQYLSGARDRADQEMEAPLMRMTFAFLTVVISACFLPPAASSAIRRREPRTRRDRDPRERDDGLRRVAAARHGPAGSRVQRVSRHGIGAAGEAERRAAHGHDEPGRCRGRSDPGEQLHRAAGAARHGARGQRAVRAPGERAGAAVPDACRSIGPPAATSKCPPARRPAPSPTAPTTRASAISTATASTRSSSSGIRRTRATTRRPACPAVS